jgi:molybdopterin-guanine dinucleotide biosynthesis protein B
LQENILRRAGMLPIISIVGRSDVGKTTYLENLVGLLNSMSYRIGTIKHDSHGNFEFDIPGKDSYRHFAAGTYVSAIFGPNKIAVQRRHHEREKGLEWIAFRYFQDVDLILTEGFKSQNYPKIEVVRKSISSEPLCREEELLALVTDVDIPYKVPKFDFYNQRPMADFLVNKFFDRQNSAKIWLLVDGKRIPCNPFVQEFLVGGILGMLGSLQGVEKPEKVSIEIDTLQDGSLIE